MKKRVKLILLVLAILIAIAIVGTKIIAKPEYTAEEMLDLVEIKLTDNMYFKEELYRENSTESEYVVERYFKDNVLYEKEKGSEYDDYDYLCDFTNNSDITINHSNQSIIKVNNYQDYDMKGRNRLKEHLEINKGLLDPSRASDKKYKYEGKENIDGKEYIKCSGIWSDSKYTIYIDVENKWISKIEFYDKVGFKWELRNTRICTYSYGTVTDDDILKFDINNYPDYEYEEYWDDVQ